MLEKDMIWLAFALYLLVINLVAFITYAVDKKRAVKGIWRISERTLLILAAVGGSVGAFLSMHIMHHKTKQMKFILCVPLFFVMQCGLLYCILNI